MLLNDRFGQTSAAPKADETGMIGAIVNWCECLHGRGSINHALKNIAESMGAEAVALTRVNRQVGGESRALVQDAGSARESQLHLKRSFAHALLGEYFDKSKPGSIWLKSMFEDDVDPSLSEFHNRRRLKELVVIPLSNNDKTVDFIEFHFRIPLKPSNHALFNTIAGTLVQTWSNRARGLFTEAILSRHSSMQHTAPTVPILSMENPASLSRAEYRVCLLLSRGQSIKKVQSELAICNSTLRSHLRNIYAKTNTGSQAKLVYQLLSLLPVADDDSASKYVA